MYNKLNNIVKAMSYFTEIALSAMIPVGIWIAIAVYVQKRFNLGTYVTVIGVVLGIITAYTNLYRLFKRISADSGKDNSTKKEE